MGVPHLPLGHQVHGGVISRQNPVRQECHEGGRAGEGGCAAQSSGRDVPTVAPAVIRVGEAALCNVERKARIAARLFLEEQKEPLGINLPSHVGGRGAGKGLLPERAVGGQINTHNLTAIVVHPQPLERPGRLRDLCAKTRTAGNRERETATGRPTVCAPAPRSTAPTTIPRTQRTTMPHSTTSGAPRAQCRASRSWQPTRRETAASRAIQAGPIAAPAASRCQTRRQGAEWRRVRSSARLKRGSSATCRCSRLPSELLL